MIKTHWLFFFNSLFLFLTTSGMMDVKTFRKNNPLIWNKQTKGTITQLPVQTVECIVDHLDLDGIIQFKRTCSWTNKNIDVEKSKKNKNSRFHKDIVESATLLTKIHRNSVNKHIPLERWITSVLCEEETKEFLELKCLLQAEPKNTHRIKQLLRENNQFPRSRSLLEDLCQLKNTDIIDSFLSIDGRGVDYSEYNASWRKEIPVCYTTAMHKNHILLDFLIGKGAKIHDKKMFDFDYQIPNLLIAFLEGNTYYVIKGDDKISDEEIEDYYSTVEVLLQNKVDPNETYGSGSRMRTALDFASEHQAERLAELLIKYEAEVNVQDPDGRTPLGTAVHYCEHKSSHCPHVKIVEFLLQNGSDPNLGHTLDIAIWRKNIRLVEALLAGGAHITPTALHRAVGIGTDETVELFLQKGANPNAIDENNNTPLDIAFLHGAIAKRKKELLLQHGATYFYLLPFRKHASTAINITITALGFTALAYMIHEYLISDSLT